MQQMIHVEREMSWKGYESEIAWSSRGFLHNITCRTDSHIERTDSNIDNKFHVEKEMNGCESEITCLHVFLEFLYYTLSNSNKFRYAKFRRKKTYWMLSTSACSLHVSLHCSRVLYNKMEIWKYRFYVFCKNFLPPLQYWKKILKFWLITNAL